MSGVAPAMQTAYDGSGRGLLSINHRSGIECEGRRAIEEGVTTPMPSDENTKEPGDDS